MDPADAPDALAPLIGAEEAEIKKSIARELERLDRVGLAPRIDEQTSLDAVAKNRLAYILALDRMILALAWTPTGKAVEKWDQLHAQARLGLSLVKHMEERHLEALKLGRQAGDESLHAEVDKLRSQISDLADHRARELKRRGQQDA